MLHAILLRVQLSGLSGTEDVGPEKLQRSGRAKRTGNTLEYSIKPAYAMLQQYQQYWAAKSWDVDVYAVADTWQGIAAPHAVADTWQGIAAPHAVDLKKYFKTTKSKSFSHATLRIIQ